MPKRSLNRVLGASSLELKCLLLFGLFLVVVITASFLMYWHVTGTVVRKQNPMTAKLLVDQALLITHFDAMEEKKSFADYLGTVSQDLRDQNFDWCFIHRPDDPDKRQDLHHRLAKNDDDGFDECKLLNGYLRNPPHEGEEEGRLVGEEYRYYQPVRVKRICWTCHSTLGPWGGFDPRRVTGELGGMPSPPRLEVGDLLSVVQVSIPNGRTQAAVNKYFGLLLAVAIITGFLALVAFYVVIRYVIIHPLQHLRQVSDAISHGNIAQRAEIHTGDEFETLAVAFNRMLRHLVTIQDELRQVNTSLDSKVDELAQVNMQLYEMNRIKSDFLATMSHELRTPLNSILGFSDVLGAIASLDEKQKRYVQNIQKSGRMLLDMINNILDLAKIESGKMEIRLTDFSIAQVIGAQCDMARPLTEKKNIDLEMEVQPELPPMHQDQARVQQVLNNLLSNAIKFTPEGGRIKVAAERSSRGDLLLRVIDTGVGIAEEDQQTIFEKFRQGQTAMPGGDAMTREYSGTGLGLSIVKEICKLLEGGVSVESELGTGSTFTVRLPWRLERQPRLDSPLVSSFEEFGKPRPDLPRDPLPIAGSSPTGERS
jgi:signal transduction histidine kinase